MKIPFKWLKEYVETNFSAEEVAEKLSLSGSEVDFIYRPKDFSKIVVGEVISVEKHPNADKLSVTKVNIGKETVQIVCGAPNLEKGQKVPVALPGAKVGELLISKVNLRDVESSGMICSEAELDISDENSGIMVLDSSISPGTPFQEIAGGDYVFDLDITPNRSDCFSVIGIAKELAATLGKKVKDTNFNKVEVKSKKKVTVEVKEKELCPRYISKVVEGVKIKSSPKWMQERLVQAGIRPINNVVDVTNYVMLEWGQPLHAFSMDKLQITNDKFQIIARRAKSGEKIKTLDGVERILTTEDLVIADTKKAIALAGVMGGANSEVNSKTSTIVLEAAVFNGTSVRKTAQRQGVRTEASNRFEKGIPLQLPELAIERAAQLIDEISKEKKEKSEVRVGENCDVLTGWIWIQHVGLRLSRLKEVLGIDIGEEETIKILKNLGMEAEKFDFKKEARKHVGKPYVWGAKFKTHGDMAFDCSYLPDYMYSRIGKFIGYVCLGQYEMGEPVSEEDLQPGDIVFVRGLIKHSPTKEYFVPNGKGGYEKRLPKLGKEVGHEAIYIGNGRVIHARQNEFDFKKNKWVPAKKAGVVEESVEVFTKNPEYLGARRFVTDPNDWIAVDVPWWRLDLKIEEDLIEEVARIYGYNNFPSTLPSGQLPLFEPNQKEALIGDVKNILVGAGFSEILSYSFLSKEVLSRFEENLESAVRIENPASPEQEYLRTTLLPSVTNATVLNQNNFEDVALFEIGNVFTAGKAGLPKEETKLGVALKLKSQKSEPFYGIKGAFTLLSRHLNLGLFEYKEGQRKGLEKGQTARICLKDKEIGAIGILSEKTRELIGIKTETAVAEINLTSLLEFYGQKKEYQKIPRYPTSIRDINITVAKSLKVSEIKKAIPEIKTIKSAEIRDIYTGKGLPESSKSITIRLRFGSDEKTLEEAEILEGYNKVVKSLEKIGGKIRA